MRPVGPAPDERGDHRPFHRRNSGGVDALGHLFLWVDKYHLCRGVGLWVAEVDLEIVDLITWDKGRMGMGYRTRRVAEYLLILQKHPQVAEGVWRKDDVPDIWREPRDPAGRRSSQAGGVAGSAD